MKSIRRSLHLHLALGLIILAAAYLGLTLDALDPFRSALATTLGLPSEAFWIIVSIVTASVLAALWARMHTSLIQPIAQLAEQCARGEVAQHAHQVLPRELVVIREHIRHERERREAATEKAQDASELVRKTKAERERAFRKLEDFQSLAAEYTRIHDELKADNRALREAKEDAEARIEKLSGELQSRSHAVPTPELQEICAHTERLHETASLLTRQWESQSLATLRRRSEEIQTLGASQLASLKGLLESIVNPEKNPPTLTAGDVSNAIPIDHDNHGAPH